MVKVLDMITSAVTIVTVADGKKNNGMTVAWANQVSFDPLMISVSISPERYTYNILKKTGIFGLNILKDGEVELAKHFGMNSGREVDKFKGIKYSINKNGLAVLDKNTTYFIEAKVVSSCQAGDHEIFVGQVTEVKKISEGQALIFKAEKYF